MQQANHYQHHSPEKSALWIYFQKEFTYEEFCGHLFRSRAFNEEGTFVALEGEEVIGFTCGWIKKEDEEVEIREGYDEFGNKLVVVYETKDEVYDVIVNKYLKKDETITFTKEENGCWYYTSSNGVDEYIYCIDDPLIRVKSTYRVNIPVK